MSKFWSNKYLRNTYYSFKDKSDLEDIRKRMYEVSIMNSSIKKAKIAS